MAEPDAEQAEPVSYGEKARALVVEAAKECAAEGERMNKLGEDIEEIVVDVQLDARERILTVLRLIAENELPVRKVFEAVYLARRIGDHRAASPGSEEDPLDEWAAGLTDALLGPTLGGTP